MTVLTRDCPNCGRAIPCDDAKRTRHCNHCGANYRVLLSGAWMREPNEVSLRPPARRWFP